MSDERVEWQDVVILLAFLAICALGALGLAHSVLSITGD